MIQINQFYVCSKVSSGSELYYLCELGRYLKNIGEVLSLNGVLFDETLKKSKYWKYFCYSIENGYVCDVNLPLADISIDLESLDLSSYFTTDLSVDETSPIFQSKDATLWSWTLGGNSIDDSITNNKLLNGTLRSQAWVSLIAMVAVKRLLCGQPQDLKLTFDTSVVYQKMSVSDILLISETSDAFNGWIDISVPNETQCLYETWLFENRDKGFMRGVSAPSVKFNYFKDEDFQIGDAVFLYVRGLSRQDDISKDISKCVIAVIREVDEKGIQLDLINTIDTQLGAKKRYEGYSSEVKALYTGSSYLKVHVGRESYQWLDIGIERILYNESNFITKLSLDDSVTLWADRTVDGKYEEHEVTVNSENGVYWILKDRGIEFNEEHFKELYFKNSVPSYDIYMSGTPIPNYTAK